MWNVAAQQIYGQLTQMFNLEIQVARGRFGVKSTGSIFYYN